MSAKVTGFILDHYPYGGGEKLVAIALADEANAEGDNIFPGVPRLARRCRMSERGVQKILRRIETRTVEGVHWFERVSYSRGGYRVTNRYRCPIDQLDEVLRRTTNTIQGIADETPNDVQGNNPEQDSGLEPKPRTGVHKTPNGGSPNPLLPTEAASDARAREGQPADGERVAYLPPADDHVPTKPEEWGTLLMQQYRFARHEVMQPKAIAMFADWCKQGLSWQTVELAIEAAHAKLRERPGYPTYYRGFVDELVRAGQHIADTRRSVNFSRPPGEQRHGTRREPDYSEGASDLENLPWMR